VALRTLTTIRSQLLEVGVVRVGGIACVAGGHDFVVFEAVGAGVGPRDEDSDGVGAGVGGRVGNAHFGSGRGVDCGLMMSMCVSFGSVLLWESLMELWR
jgi:hypothetical protein